MNDIKFGFIGCGNMGGALVRAVSKSVGSENVYIADKAPTIFLGCSGGLKWKDTVVYWKVLNVHSKDLGFCLIY